MNRLWYILILLSLTVLIFTTVTQNSTEEFMPDSNVFEMLNYYPLSIILGTPLVLFGALIYYLMKDNGRNACLISSSVFVAGLVSVITTFFMPVDSSVLGLAIFIGGFGIFVAIRIYKDLKEKNYLQ